MSGEGAQEAVVTRDGADRQPARPARPRRRQAGHHRRTFSANVDVVRDGQAVSARSIMGLMMLGAGMGSSVELRADGFDAHEALDALAGLIEAGFNEQD